MNKLIVIFSVLLLVNGILSGPLLSQYDIRGFADSSFRPKKPLPVNVSAMLGKLGLTPPGANKEPVSLSILLKICDL